MRTAAFCLLHFTIPTQCDEPMAMRGISLFEGAPMANLVSWLDRHNVSMAAVLATIGVVIGAFVLSYLLRRSMRDSLRQWEARLRLPYETMLTTTRLLIGTLWIIAAMVVLEIWGVSVGGLWTLAVSAVTIIGVGFLATWTMISNVTASFFIAFWHPFRLGDTIEMLPEKLSGRVIDRNLMFVVVRENSGAIIQIPNNLFFQKMFKVSGNGNKTPFEEYELGTDDSTRDRLDRAD
jgi:small-conductance mechanosensitive channel